VLRISRNLFDDFPLDEGAVDARVFEMHVTAPSCDLAVTGKHEIQLRPLALRVRRQHGLA